MHESLHRYNAIILGGGKSPLNDSEHHGMYKGNTQFCGRALGSIVYEAVAKGHTFDRIALVMERDNELQIRESQDVYSTPDPAMCRNFFRSLKFYASANSGNHSIDDGVADNFVFAGDLPFLRAEHVKAFYDAVHLHHNVDVAIPIIPRGINESAFPDRLRHYLRFKEGEYLIGNMAYLSQNAMRENCGRLEKLYEGHDDKWSFLQKIVEQVGLKTVLHLHPTGYKVFGIEAADIAEKFFRAMSIKEFEEHAAKFLHLGTNGNERAVKLIELNHPEMAYDIDTAEDFREAERLNKSMYNLEAIVKNSD